MTNLTIMHAPNHAPSLTRPVVQRIFNRANSAGVDSIGWTEAYARIPFIRLHSNWRLIVGQSKTDKRRGGKDNPIAVNRHRGIKWIGCRAEKVCPAARPVKYNPERWVTYACYVHPSVGKVAHVAIHPDPINNWVKKWLRNKRVALPANAPAFKKTMASLEAIVKDLQAQGYLVVITADINCHNFSGADSWMPQEVFKRLDLNTYYHGIDAIAYDKRLKLAKPVQVIPKAKVGKGEDHDQLIASFTRASA